MAACWLARQPLLSELSSESNGATPTCRDFGIVPTRRLVVTNGSPAPFHLSRITQTEAATWHESIANHDGLQHS
jgi:hypothetical protein